MIIFAPRPVSQTSSSYKSTYCTFGYWKYENTIDVGSSMSHADAQPGRVTFWNKANWSMGTAMSNNST